MELKYEFKKYLIEKGKRLLLEDGDLINENEDVTFSTRECPGMEFAIIKGNIRECVMEISSCFETVKSVSLYSSY